MQLPTGRDSEANGREFKTAMISITNRNFGIFARMTISAGLPRVGNHEEAYSNSTCIWAPSAHARTQGRIRGKARHC